MSIFRISIDDSFYHSYLVSDFLQLYHDLGTQQHPHVLPQQNQKHLRLVFHLTKVLKTINVPTLHSVPGVGRGNWKKMVTNLKMILLIIMQHNTNQIINFTMVPNIQMVIPPSLA